MASLPHQPMYKSNRNYPEANASKDLFGNAKPKHTHKYETYN